MLKEINAKNKLLNIKKSKKENKKVAIGSKNQVCDEINEKNIKGKKSKHKNIFKLIV